MAVILAIETSCDETSVAIIKNGKLLSNAVATQIAMHRKYGGVMPEIASRLHNENIVIVLNEALKEAKIKLSEVDAVAVTRGPGLIGALHVGLQAAKTISLIYNIPLIPVHHLAAHIYAGEFVGKFTYPLLALVVSGGNTELVLMKKHLDFKVIGETKDDAIGECFDKVARTLGLPYPGGIPIDKRAKLGKHTYKLPSPLSKGYDFSYSGLKTSVINLVNQERMKKHKINLNDMCRSFEDTAVDMVVDKTIKAAKEYKVKQVVVAGGVSANSYLRNEIIKKLKNSGISLLLPPLWATGDNAAMIAKIGEHLYREKLFAPLSLGVDPNWKIDKFRVF